MLTTGCERRPITCVRMAVVVWWCCCCGVPSSEREQHYSTNELATCERAFHECCNTQLKMRRKQIGVWPIAQASKTAAGHQQIERIECSVLCRRVCDVFPVRAACLLISRPKTKNACYMSYIPMRHARTGGWNMNMCRRCFAFLYNLLKTIIVSIQQM